jgi:hypothetical protein
MNNNSQYRSGETTRGQERSTEGGGGGVHFACGVVGLVVTLAIIGATYSLVVAVTSPLAYLSTTALVLVGVFVWLFVWFVVDRSVATLRR